MAALHRQQHGGPPSTRTNKGPNPPWHSLRVHLLVTDTKTLSQLLQECGSVRELYESSEMGGKEAFCRVYLIQLTT